MPQLTRTTITLPEQLLTQLKMKSTVENSSVSFLISEMVEKSLYQKKIIRLKKDPLEVLGQLKLGARKIYTNRDKLYENHLKRKLGA